MDVLDEYKNRRGIKLYLVKAKGQHRLVFSGILKRLGNIRGKKILDIGTGPGNFAFQLSKKGAHVTGIDISKQQISLATESFGNKNLKFIQGDARKLKWRDSSFDLATLNFVTTATPKEKDMHKLFAEASRVLKKGGWFVITDINPVILGLLHIGIRKIFLPKHFSYFKGGQTYKTIIRSPSHKPLTLTNAHWSLEKYAKLMVKNGLELVQIFEPPLAYSGPKDSANFPEFIVFFCKKR